MSRDVCANPDCQKIIVPCDTRGCQFAGWIHLESDSHRCQPGAQPPSEIARPREVKAEK